MSRLFNCLIVLTVLITLSAMIDATGFPPSCPCGGGGSSCGGGGGGGCGCAGGGGYGRRRRREAAVQPHYKADETPCPQAAWKEILEEAIQSDDAVASVNAIQTGLFRRYNNQKFLVTCATAEEKTGPSPPTTGNKVHFSSSGDAYCNHVKERVWCQAVALSA